MIATETSLFRLGARIALAPLGAVFLWRLVHQVAYCVWAVGYPYELDYGEGIVWEQMRRMLADQSYGPIDGFPAIVFHYPPGYHLTSASVSAILGMDPLAAGRAVSTLGFAVAATVAALIVIRILGRARPRLDRIVGGIGAACLLAGMTPVVFWLPVMRVDMLALGLSLSGLWLAMLAIDRPRLIYLAAVAFVLALFTKQTMIAAPVATFSILLAVRPRLAGQGIAAAVLLGAALLGWLEWHTQGGFVRHVFLYNINRVDLSGLTLLAQALRDNALAIFAAGLAVWFRGAPLIGRILRTRSWDGLRALDRDGQIPLAMVLVHFGVTSVMLVMIAKSGASQNYMIEWMSSVAMLAGLTIAEVAALARGERAGVRPAITIAATAALALQLCGGPKTRGEMLPRLRPEREYAALATMIRAAKRPVISDDMVAVLRGGKEVVWEPAIFAELDGSPYFSSKRLVDMIREHKFAFFVTFGRQGDAPFDARYTPPMAAAMRQAYPRLEGLANLTIHRPLDRESSADLAADDQRSRAR